MTIDQILNRLEGGSKIVSLLTRTEPDTKKKDSEGNPRPFQTLVRISRRRGMIGVSYENAVNRQRLREGQPGDQVVEEFKAEALWKGQGEHDGHFTVRHKGTGQRYLCFKPQQSPAGDVLIDTDMWIADEEIVTFEAISPWLRDGGSSSRQQVDRPVAWRTVKLENILEIQCGEVFQVG